MFRQFAPDFFDLVIVDECHRGSARAESSWRAILDYFSPATQLGMTATPKRDETADSYEYFGDPVLFRDPDFDGPPERLDEEEIDDEGNVVDDTVVEEPEPIFGPAEVGDIGRDGDGSMDPDDLEDEPTAKFYVDDTEVWVTAEATYHLDPETQRLRLVEYRDFVTETVRALFPDPNELRSKWSSRVGRQDVLDALDAHGIDATDLIERTGLAGADPIDVLVHVAWNQPLATRTDRARRVRKEHAAFFDAYQPAARDVLAFLLDKYAEHGIGQLDDLAVLQVPPLSSLGSPSEIAARFGSADALKDAVAKLGELLYAS